MKRRPRCRWAHWRIDNVMLNLCRRSNPHDLVLKKGAIGIVGMPKFWIENFVQRARLEGIERRKANHMAAKIIRHVAPVTDLRESTRGQRFINFFARVRWQAGELAIRQAISHRADFPVDGIGPEIHETDAIIQQLRWRNHRVVWRHLLGLISVLHIEIRAHNDFVVITVERDMKRRITFVGRAENDVEHDEPRAGPEQPIEQERPDFTRPRVWPLGQQLKRPVAGDFFRRHRRQLQCALIDSEKYEIVRRWSFSPLAPEQILKALLTAPWHGEERRGREEMTEKNQPGPKNAD